MFYCFIHNWYSTDAPCPVCHPPKETTLTNMVINPEGTSEVKEERPPLGIIPEWRWKELRFEEVSEAINRYEYLNKEAPKEWRDEYYSLREWLQNRLSQQQSKTSETQAGKGTANDADDEWDRDEYVRYVEEENMKSHGWIIESVELKGKIYPHEYWFSGDIPNHGFNGNSYGYFVSSKIRPNYFSVHSVKRLSDKEVFTIGDEVYYIHIHTKERKDFIIGAFSIVNIGECVVWPHDPPHYLIGVPYCEIKDLCKKSKPDTKERIEVKALGEYVVRTGSYHKLYEFRTSHQIDLIRHKSQIEQAIEKIINNDEDIESRVRRQEFNIYQAQIVEVEKNAFEAGRDRIGGFWNEQIKNWKYNSFADYLKHKDK